jgi:hypothetical protein
MIRGGGNGGPIGEKAAGRPLKWQVIKRGSQPIGKPAVVGWHWIVTVRQRRSKSQQRWGEPSMSWVVLAYLCSMVNTSDCTYVTCLWASDAFCCTSCNQSAASAATFAMIDRRLDRAGLQGRSIPSWPFSQLDRIHQSIPRFRVIIWDRSGRRDSPVKRGQFQTATLPRAVIIA